MSLEENKELVRRLIEEVWNEHRLERLSAFVGGDLLDESTQHTEQFFAAFPDVSVTIEQLIAEGDFVAGRLLISGTNTGPFADRPATGKRVVFGSFRFYRFADGKVVETWAMQDRMGLMEQLDFVRSVGSVNWAAGQAERTE
jgi:predicted ester cyclase